MNLSSTLNPTSAQPSHLGQPVGAMVRASVAVGSGDSILRAAHELRISGNSLIPVLEWDRLVGVVTEESLARALAEGIDLSSSTSSIMVDAPKIRTYMTGAEALRMFDGGFGPTLVVVDEADHVVGLLGASDLVPRRLNPPRPAMVGGMATPFGVYLTDGSVTGGVGNLALMSAGAALFSMLLVAQIIASPFIASAIYHGWPTWSLDALKYGLPIGLFMIFMRLAPISGTHAAEHMTVHALERGEELTPNVVARMPRVHPRCGTNLATGAAVFLTIFGFHWVNSRELRFIAAALVTLYAWRQVGGLVQYYVTTKRPNARQIESGIRAGRQLLDNFAKTRAAVPSVPMRIVRSGMLQVMAGSTAALVLAYLVALALDHFFHLHIGPILD